MTLTASKLRENIYRLLDQLIETGEPIEIRRRGYVLRIVVASSEEEGKSKLDRLIPRPDFISDDPDDLVHLDWSGEWRP